MACLKGLEPPTHCLEGNCSIQLSYRHIYGAGDGNRTHATSLEGWNSTIELHPRIITVTATDLDYYIKMNSVCQYLFQKYYPAEARVYVRDRLLYPFVFLLIRYT